MPILALQETVNEIAPVLQNIFQQSLNESKTPSDCKKRPKLFQFSKKVIEQNLQIIDQLVLQQWYRKCSNI